MSQILNFKFVNLKYWLKSLILYHICLISKIRLKIRKKQNFVLEHPKKYKFRFKNLKSPNAHQPFLSLLSSPPLSFSTDPPPFPFFSMPLEPNPNSHQRHQLTPTWADNQQPRTQPEAASKDMKQPEPRCEPRAKAPLQLLHVAPEVPSTLPGLHSASPRRSCRRSAQHELGACQA